MPRYMLNTDISSYLIRGDHPEVTDAFRQHFPDVCISAITAAELQYGAQKRKSQLLTRNVNAYCNLVPICEWTREAAETSAEMRVELEKHGTPVGSMDMLIAASAIAEGTILVTNNIAHFSKIGKLRVENWSAS